MARRLFAGASGYSFKEWCGPFYPEKLKPDAMLGVVLGAAAGGGDQQHLLPDAGAPPCWSTGRRPRRRTSASRSRRRAASRTSRGSRTRRGIRSTTCTSNSAALGDKRGPVLFQLPPNLKKDLPRLAAFLADAAGATIAPPSSSATTPGSTTRSTRRCAAPARRSCVSEREDGSPPPLEPTADWGYVRLRLEEYSDDALRDWAQRLAATGWKEIYAFFMHEPTAPAYAQELMRHFG